MDNLATRAFRLPRKITKKKAMLALEELAQGAESDETLEQLATLYSYFKPSTPATPKTEEEWVACAAGVHDVREYLHCLRADKGRLVATDGIRMHICPTELPDGAYDSQLNPVDARVAGTFPDWRAVSGHNDAMRSYATLGAVREVGRVAVLPSGVRGDWIVLAIAETETRLDRKMWLQASSIFGPLADVAASGDPVFPRVSIKGGGRQAVVMGCRD